MKIKEIQAQMEAILFANGEPMEITRLSQVLEVEEETSEKILTLLSQRYGGEESGLCLLRLGGYGSNFRASPVEPKGARSPRPAKECAAFAGGHGSAGGDCL